MDTLFPVSELKTQLLRVIVDDLSSLRYERRRAAKVVLRVMRSEQSKDLGRDEMTALLTGILSNEHQLPELSALLHRFCGSSREYASVICNALLQAIHVESDTSTIVSYVDILMGINGLTTQVTEGLFELVGNRSRTAKDLMLDAGFRKSMEQLSLRAVEAIEEGVEYGGVVVKGPVSNETLPGQQFLECSATHVISLSAAKALLLLLSCGLSTELNLRIIPPLKAALSGCSSDQLHVLEPAIVSLLSLNNNYDFSILYEIPFPRLLSIINDSMLSVSDDCLLDFSRRISSSHDMSATRQIIVDSAITDLSYLYTILQSLESNRFTEALEQLLSDPSSRVNDKDAGIEVAMEVGGASGAPDDETTAAFDLNSVEAVAINILKDACTQHVNGVPLVFKLVERADCLNKSVLAGVVTQTCLDEGFGDQLIEYLTHNNEEGQPLEKSTLRTVFNILYQVDDSTLSKFVSRSLSRMDAQNAQLNFIYAYGACRILYERKFSAWRELLGSLLDFLLIVEGDFEDADIELLAPISRSDMVIELPTVLVRIISAGGTGTLCYEICEIFVN